MDDDIRLTSVQRRGLLFTGLTVVAYAAVVLSLWLPDGAPLRGDGGALVPSPLLSGIVPVLFGAFLLAGTVYGFTVKTLSGSEGVVTAMTDAVRNMAGYVVMMFVAAQVIAVFNFGAVVADRAGLRPRVHAPRHEPGTQPGGVPHRGLGDRGHHPDEPVRVPAPGPAPALRTGGARPGTLISRPAIFVVPFLAVWLAILAVFYGFGPPLVPGAGIGFK